MEGGVPVPMQVWYRIVKFKLISGNWIRNEVKCERNINPKAVLWKLDALQTFITDLSWPEPVFATHLQHRLKDWFCYT